MGIMNEVFGGNHKFHHKGTDYVVQPLTNDMITSIENDAYADAVAKLARVKEILTPEDYRTRTNKLADDFMDGKFAMGKETKLGVAPGVDLMAKLFGVSKDEAFDLMIERPDEISALFGVLKNDSFPDEEVGAEKKTPQVVVNPTKR